MLYDKRWDKEVKADPFSLEGLISWLEKQDQTEIYNFYCAGECMVGQWVQSIDPKARPADKEGWGADFYVVQGQIHNLGSYVVIANSGEEDGMTFGAALERARATLAYG